MGLFGSLLSKLSKRQSDAVVPLEMAAPAGEIVAAVDWRSSSAHLNLLTRFLSPKFRPDRLSEAWPVALGEPPASAIARFVAEGLLQPMSPEQVLDSSLTVAKLTSMLKVVGANVSGNKRELIDRLLVVAPQAAAQACQDDRLECTVEGRAVAERRLADLAEGKSRAVAESRLLVRSGKYAEAYAVAAEHQKNESIDDRTGGPFSLIDRAPVESLKLFAMGRPRIFGDLPEDAWEALRQAAAMSALWGGWLKPWLPESLDRIGRFDLQASYIIMSAYASDRRTRRTAAGSNWRGTIIASGACCEVCKKILGEPALIESLPELPYPLCQNSTGPVLCSFSLKSCWKMTLMRRLDEGRALLVAGHFG